MKHYYIYLAVALLAALFTFTTTWYEDPAAALGFSIVSAGFAIASALYKK